MNLEIPLSLHYESLTHNSSHSDYNPRIAHDAANEYDICFVFDIGDKDKDIIIEEGEERKKVNQFELFEEEVINLMVKFEKACLKFTLFKSEDEQNVFCYLTAFEKRFKDEAERVEYELVFDPDKAFQSAKDMEMVLAEATEDGDIYNINMDTWKYLYAPFTPNDDEFEQREDLYQKYAFMPKQDTDEKKFVQKYEKCSLFRTADRIKLLFIILEAEEEVRGCELSLDDLVEDSDYPLNTYYVLHEQKELAIIKKKVRDCDSLFHLPLPEIRDYYGEQTAFYFAFLEFYSKALTLPAFFGAVGYIWQWVVDRPNIPYLFVYGLFMSVWSTLFLEKWKRYQAILRGQWGMNNFAHKEQSRPGFEGTKTRTGFTGQTTHSEIHGKKVQYTPTKVRVIKNFISYSIIMTLIMLVISFFVSIIFLRNFLEYGKGLTGEQSDRIVSMIYSIGVQLLNIFYAGLASKLTDWEQHKTDTEYENSVISKRFIFEAVNSYGSLFYIAYVQRYDPTSGCPVEDPACQALLRYSLQSLFISHILRTNLLKFWPVIKAKFYCFKNRDLFHDATEGEKDFHLKTEYAGTLDDFDDLVIYHGYASLFVIAYPITPLFALLGKLVDSKVLCYLLVNQYRRPEIKGACSIGTWYTIFVILGYLNVITNVALITIAGDFMAILNNPSMLLKVVFFIIMEHMLILLKNVIDYCIPDEPIEERIRLLRQNYLVTILLGNAYLPDIDDDKNLSPRTAEKEKQKKTEKIWF